MGRRCERGRERERREKRERNRVGCCMRKTEKKDEEEKGLKNQSRQSSLNNQVRRKCKLKDNGPGRK